MNSKSKSISNSVYVNLLLLLLEFATLTVIFHAIFNIEIFRKDKRLLEELLWLTYYIISIFLNTYVICFCALFLCKIITVERVYGSVISIFKKRALYSRF